MSVRLDPWWIRFEPWWREQRRYLEDERLAGSTSYDAAAHVAVWRGTLRAASRRWRLLIRWGPGTPFFPPRLFPLDCRSGMHQLNDGSMCLVPPSSLEEGWRGVQDLGVWIERAVAWIDGYVGQGWEMSPVLWPFHAARMPGPEHRPLLPPMMLVALPPEWRRGLPDAAGTFCAHIPRQRAGMGAVVSFCAEGKPRRWDAGAALVTGGYDALRGVWCRLDVRATRDAERLMRREAARFVRKRRPLLWAVVFPSDAGGDDRWMFTELPGDPLSPSMRPDSAPLDPFRRLGPWPGVSLDPLVLGARRRIGRGDDVSARITSTRVLFAGLGALGSEVAHLLAQKGVRRFVLIDGDVLVPGNVARHRADLADAGRAKVDAMRQAILRIDPSVEVIPAPGWLDEIVPRLNALADAPSIALGMTGHEGSEHVLGDLCTRMGIGCLHAWLEMDGRVLRLARVLPGQDPPLAELALRPEDLPFLPRGAIGPAACAEAILPGSAANIHAAANFVARIALDLAAGRCEPQNHWLFAPGGIDDPDPRVAPALRQRYGVATFSLRRRDKEPSTPS